MRPWSWLLGLATLVVAPLAHAGASPDIPIPLPREPKHDFALGASVAHAWPEELKSGAMFGLDVTYLPESIFWLSGGARYLQTQSDVRTGLLPYAEAGLWLVMNFGVGYTWSLGGPQHHGPHLFFGFPFPIARDGAEGFGQHLFIEPYYRVSYVSDDALNELGVLLKWTSLKFE